ncbi:gamma-glutamyl-gamma-aminobutyrate hydrolase family protein [Streptoalloteichus tenebrarius]|uniref:gamma-glutamyl-gamma-aminobutyrate hydrolase family protein n=1 Tax=Streptoalloteichus tenebrarius (strain ATCC 17920 / DSM 40477 / JCM 4838 / CBS 697.72 / NBRC 16177 / NCIMB 11028 / NRRL B-12390 / A12253. 1 / ISP 5477) TaxID=1933 RepID=UPI0020A33B95|nr:gamma-glutamyl-gamma-aminobutyrate hydrolase family protein [Streptoalloteichus tenebrarius]
MSRPLIGVSTYSEVAGWGVWRRPADLLPRSYSDIVLRAGGVPVLLPPLETGAAEVVRALDGLVLAGGADVDPATYRAKPHPRTTETRPERDSWELGLLRHALDRDLPVLGVCRGMQLLNVGYGGTLRQHLPDDVGHAGHRPAPALFGSTTVRVDPGSGLARWIGPRCAVSCYHHQAVAELGAGLAAVAWAEDGTVEAVEDARRAFVVGVQWHPEQDAETLPDQDQDQDQDRGGAVGEGPASAALRLFAALVEVARTRADTRENR